MWSGLGGSTIKSWQPPSDWHDVEGQNHDIGEPPLPSLKQRPKSYVSKTTGQTKTFQPPDKRLSSGVIMREPDGRTWLVKPTNGFGGYNWTFPKGGVEDGLHPQASAIKETFEETGLHARITGYAGDYHGDTSVTRMYRAERVGGHPKDKGWETEQVALAHPNDLDHMLNRSRDRKIAAHHVLGDASSFDPDEPRDEHGKWTSGGGSFPAKSQLVMSDLTKVSGKKGSNEGGVYEYNLGKQYYVKQPATPDHVQNELLTARLYQLAGVKTLNYVPVQGGAHVATEMEQLAKTNVSQLDPAERMIAQKYFAVHAWLANWDAAGTGGDNVGVRKNGQVVTLDTGGGLKYRAQGEPKGIAFGNEVSEINTLRDASKNPDAAKLFGDMTNDQMIESMNRVTSIPTYLIKDTILKNGGDQAMVDKLISRRNDLQGQAQKLGSGAKVFGKAQTILGPNTSVAPAVVDHPAKSHLPHVKGTSAERVAWRKELDNVPKNSELAHDLKQKIIASFWKQHGKLSGDKQTEIAGKLAQYSKKYGMTNPLTQPKTAVAGPFPYTAPPLLSQAEKTAHAAQISQSATQADLEKAKKSAPLSLQYVPGAPQGHPEAQKLVDQFNQKYAGKTLSESELNQKVADFKKLQSDMIPLMSEQQKNAAAVAAKAHVEQVAIAAKLKAEEAAKLNDPVIKEHYRVLKSIGVGKPSPGMVQLIAKHKLAITPEQGMYIRAYVGSHYGPVNDQLRKGVLTMAQHKYADALNGALDKMPVYVGNVERGAHLTPEAFKKYQDAVGGVAVEHQFTSAGVNGKLWGSHTFHIKSKSAADIRSFNPSEGGGEVVFRAGSKFHVTKVDVPSKQIWMEQL